MGTAELILTVAGILAALGTIFAAFRWTYRTANRIENNLGVDKDGRSVAERMARVEHQVFPNGGGSLSDQVHNVAEAVIEIKAKTDIIEQLLVNMVAGNAYSNNTKRSGRSPREAKPDSVTKQPTKQTRKVP